MVSPYGENGPVSRSLEDMESENNNGNQTDGKKRRKGTTTGAATAIGVGVGVALLFSYRRSHMDCCGRRRGTLGRRSYGGSIQVDDPPISKPLCVKGIVFGCLGRGWFAWPVQRAWWGVVLRLGPGSDLSEVPVFQGMSRSRWTKSRPWVSSRTCYPSSWWRFGCQLRVVDRRHLRYVV